MEERYGLRATSCGQSACSKLAAFFLISLQVFSIRGVRWSIVARNIIGDG